MKLNDFFDGIYCLTLPHRKEDRWEANCLPQFETQQIINVQPVYGVYGKDLDFSHSSTEVNIHRKCELGSALGHLNAIQRAQSDGVKRCLIVEDDIRFIEDINHKFDEIHNQIPANYDMLYFGGNHVGGLQPISSNVFKLRHTYALQMYSVHEHAYDLLINYLQDCINYCRGKPEQALNKWVSWAGDFFIASIQPSMGCYLVKPNDERNFSWQMDENFSDIQQAPMTYDFLKK
jgi:GR25 family glycosyltransferase involved in LPS biosynthesis